MSTFLLQRAGWSLQIARSSRHLTFTFVAKLPRHQSFHTPSRLASVSSGLRSSRRSQQAWSQAFSSSSTARQEPKPPANESPVTAPDLSGGFNDEPLILDEGLRQIDWSRSFHGLSTEAFPKETADILLAPIAEADIEAKPDGLIYLPEIKYRRILNRAFGPGAWGLAPRGETIVTAKTVTREYALVARGRLISIARGEQDYFSPEGIPTATEGCKSNALMRCCKDLGVASELWDPKFIRKFVEKNVKEVWVENVVTKKRRKISMLKDGKVAAGYKIATATSPTPSTATK